MKGGHGGKAQQPWLPMSKRTKILLLGTSIAFAAILLVLDPFRLSILGNDPTFKAHRVKLPPRFAISSLLGDQQPRDAESKLSRARRWQLDAGLMGPESLAMDPHGNGPYVGVADGRIMRWDSQHNIWQEFAHTSPNRSAALCKEANPKNEHICGRPLGLRFDPRSGDLYIADAYLGLMRVGPEGGQASVLANAADGVPLRFTNDLDIAPDGSVYFTDSSSKYQRRNFFLLVLSAEDSGRVLRYDPATGESSVLLSGLQFPNGVALSRDRSFLIIAESVPGRLLRYWLTGPKKGEVEVLAMLPGYPDNVRVNKEGDIWVAMHCRRNAISTLSGAFPALRHAFLQLPIPFKRLYRLFNGKAHGILAKYAFDHGPADSSSAAVHLALLLEDVHGNVVKYASEVDERDGQLWIGSVLLPYISVYDLQSQPADPLPA